MNAAKCQGYNFYLSELLRENQHGGGCGGGGVKKRDVKEMFT